MPASPILCADELSYLSRLFESDKERDVSVQGVAGTRSISTSTELPALIPPSLLGNARLTLLAEIGCYRLTFPVEVKVDEFNQVRSVIGIPEIIETGGPERSWRCPAVDDIVLSGDEYSGTVTVESVSSTGIALQLSCERTAEHLLAQDRLRLRLPDGKIVVARLEPIRREQNLLAARIVPQAASRDLLCGFLFEKHRANHPKLYRGVRLPGAARDN